MTSRMHQTDRHNSNHIMQHPFGQRRTAAVLNTTYSTIIRLYLFKFNTIVQTETRQCITTTNQSRPVVGVANNKHPIHGTTTQAFELRSSRPLLCLPLQNLAHSLHQLTNRKATVYARLSSNYLKTKTTQ
jgi:hypothetical protein